MTISDEASLLKIPFSLLQPFPDDLSMTRQGGAPAQQMLPTQLQDIFFKLFVHLDPVIKIAPKLFNHVCSVTVLADSERVPKRRAARDGNGMRMPCRITGAVIATIQDLLAKRSSAEQIRHAPRILQLVTPRAHADTFQGRFQTRLLGRRLSPPTMPRSIGSMARMRHALSPRSSALLCCENHPSDFLGDVRDDGVAQGSQSVYPMGYPISHSTNCGFREPHTMFLPWLCNPSRRLAVGVGIIAAAV